METQDQMQDQMPERIIEEMEPEEYILWHPEMAAGMTEDEKVARGIIPSEIAYCPHATDGQCEIPSHPH